MAGKFRYNNIILIFDQFWNVFLPERINKQNTNISDSGIVETNTFYNKYLISIKRTYLSESEIRQLEEWWRYVRDGSSFELWRNSDICLYLSFEGKSLLTNDEDSPTFTRTGVANTIDYSTGLITSIAANTGRFTTGKFGTGLLIETSLTNMVHESERFNANGSITAFADAGGGDVTVTSNNHGLVVGAVVWITGTTNYNGSYAIIGYDTNTFTITVTWAGDDATGTWEVWIRSNITVTANQILSPDGNLTADKLAATASSAYIYQYLNVTIGTTDGTFSIYLRCLSGEIDAQLELYDTGANQLGISSITVTSVWQRFSISYDVPSSNVNDWIIRIKIIDNTNIIYAWGAQFEQSIYPTSYIADGSTRGNEAIVYDINSNIFNNLKFSLSAWIKVPYDYDEIISELSLFQIYDNDNSKEFVSCSINASPPGFYLLVNDYAGNNIINENLASTELTKNIWHYIVFTIDTTISNGGKAYFDGVLVDTTTNDAFIPGTFDQLLIGNENIGAGAGADQIDGIIDDVSIENKILTQGEITARYNSNRALGFRKNYFSAVKITDSTFNPVQRTASNRWDFDATFEEVLS